MQFTVNTESLKAAAEKLVARLNDMGVVSKTGKPLVVDQGYEAIAALFGYRNQHVLRHALTQPEAQQQWVTDVVAANECKQELLEKFGYRFEQDHGLDAWVVTFNGDEQTPVFTELMFAVEQTWDNVVAEAMAAQMVSKDIWRAMTPDNQEALVTRYLQSVGWTPDLIPQLQAAGYTVCMSDFKRPYWEHEDSCEGSEDFDTEELAWMDAWRHAKEHFVRLEPVLDAQSPMADAIQELVDSWADGDQWGEHPHYDRAAWQHEVSNGDTNLGYWEWVVHQIDANGGEEEHCEECGCPLDGDSADGLCGDCADKASCTECGELLPSGHDGHVCPDCLARDAETPTIDRRCYTDYSFSIGELNHDQLMDECADRGIPYMECISKPSDELRSMLLEKYDHTVREAADEAGKAYFAEIGAQVAAVGGWESTEEGHSMLLKCAVFVENPALPDADTQKVLFTVELVNCEAVNSSISK